jgi:hypothetical protein
MMRAPWDNYHLGLRAGGGNAHGQGHWRKNSGFSLGGVSEDVSGLQSEKEEETVTTNVSAMGQDGLEKEKEKEKKAEEEKEGKEKENKTRRHRYTRSSESIS